jgi:hypothetical protein
MKILFKNIMVNKKLYLLIIIAICFACNKKSVIQGQIQDQIVGKWTRASDTAQMTVINFHDSGSYILEIQGQDKYPGKYSVVKDTLKLVDTYCGTSLPGRYTIALKGSSNFTLSLIDDKFCGRKDFFPADWSKIK